MRTKRVLSLLPVLAWVLLGTPPKADAVPIGSVTLDSCPTCFGSAYTLALEDLGGGTLQATLDVDTSGFTGNPPADSISAAEIKVASLVDESSVVLTMAPTALAGWTTMAGPLSNGGCGGISDGFICSQASGPAYFATVGGTLTWQWEFELPEGVDLAFPEEGHIGAKYNNSVAVRVGSNILEPGSLNGWITSEPIPEPSSTILFGVGALVVGGALRKKLIR